MRKPCPVCNSRKTRENRKYFVCENCGYILKKQLDLSPDEALVIYQSGKTIQIVQDEETLRNYKLLLDDATDKKKKMSDQSVKEKIKKIELTPDLKEKEI